MNIIYNFRSDNGWYGFFVILSLLTFKKVKKIEQKKEELFIKLNNQVEQEVNPAFIIFFGSFTKDAVREESDIDLAYFSNKQLSSYDRFLLTNELATIGEREVDLVDIKEIDTVFTMQIFAQGIPIYIQDENEFICQRMRAFSMYATLIVYEGNPENLTDFTNQDSIVLNIQRACEASIDLAMHVVSERKLGVPKTSLQLSGRSVL